VRVATTSLRLDDLLTLEDDQAGIDFHDSFARALEAVVPPQMSYRDRTRRCGENNGSYDSGNHTRDRQNTERKFKAAYQGLRQELRRHPWRPDAFSPRKRGKAVHLWLFFRVGLSKEGLVVPRTFCANAWDRFEGVFIVPKCALPLMRCLTLVARQLAALLADLPVTGRSTGLRTTREAVAQQQQEQVAVQEFEARKARALRDLEQLARGG
jgi:hypothetical protein